MFGIPLHRLVIHFPIALTIIALFYDSWALYSKRVMLHTVGYGLTLWAALSALLAVVTGLQLAGVSRVSAEVITGHAGLGLGSSVLIATLGILRYSAMAREQTEFRMVWLILEIGAAILIAATAVTGHQL
jgi:uncharacterized membrane protein